MKLLSFAAITFAAVWLAAGAPRSAKAQSQFVPPEVVALFNDIDDIDKLRVLNPLNLTPEQIDKLIPTIQQAQQDYNKKLADAAVPPIKEIAAQIKATRRRLLSGGEVPKDFDERVKKIQAEFIARRDKEDAATLKSLVEAIRGILTPQQVGAAVTEARKALGEQNKSGPKADEDRLFSYYVLQVFITYPRILPLLQDMRDARAKNSGLQVLSREARR
ncbi:MAG: hypothetical protein ACP5VE_13195 [Chthonomonadales bacterium]